MSEHVYAEPHVTKEVHFDQDHQDRTVDIYVSTESLRVYEQPWVEHTSTHILGLGETQQSGMNTLNTDGHGFVTSSVPSSELGFK